MAKVRKFYTARRTLALGKRTHLMGILNLTPDSFSDGGDFNEQPAAEAQFFRMVEEGAVIVDVGGESTRPGHEVVSVEEEIRRTVPFIRSIRSHAEVLISIDTSKSEVAAAALEAGADIVNDVWGAQRDPAMAEIIAGHGASCVLMHNRKPSEAGQGDIVTAVLEFFEKSIQMVVAAGGREDAIILDPGLGFGKSYDENWEIMRRLDEIVAIGYPILIGASRKSMIAKLLQLDDPKDRLNGTLATSALAIQSGVDFIRAHDVLENRQCADVADHCLRV
ncbi:MAG: dihydropteroate synthase [Verrucomicrobiota bacterium]